MLTRRDFLRTATVAAGAGLTWPLASQGWAAPGELVTISILHTTDLHGHVLPGRDYANTPDLGGLARCATQLKRWRAENPHTLLVDLGDLYQGTPVGWQTQGKVMIDCVNQLGYDAWVIGNHEFDWGADALRQAIRESRMPVLSANAKIAGQPVNAQAGGAAGWENLRGVVVKEVAGLRVALVGVTTPGIPYWIPDDLVGEYTVQDAVAALRPVMAELEGKVDAIVICAHMGLHRPDATDDFANQVNAICAEFPSITAFIGAHTHKDQPSLMVGGRVPYTQANYHGINVGRLDLSFDPGTRKVVTVQPQTLRMDAGTELDPAILSLTHKPLELVAEYLQTKVGTFSAPFSDATAPGRPSDLERLYGQAFMQALQQRGVEVDAVFHGLFWNMGDGPAAGEKNIEHIWRLIPFENMLVTATMTGEQLTAVLKENYVQKSGYRNLMGKLRCEVGENRQSVKIFRGTDTTPVAEREPVRIAMNAYDAQSGGQRLNALRTVLAEPAVAATRVTHPLQSREALIDFIKARGNIGPADLPA